MQFLTDDAIEIHANADDVAVALGDNMIEPTVVVTLKFKLNQWLWLFRNTKSMNRLLKDKVSYQSCQTNRMPKARIRLNQ